MRLKDEASQNEEPEISMSVDEVEETHQPEQPNFIDRIRLKLDKEIGDRSGLRDIRPDDSWDGLLAQMKRVGAFFGTGKLKVVYMDRGELNDFILVPNNQTAVISVSPKCPRDRIMQVLGG